MNNYDDPPDVWIEDRGIKVGPRFRVYECEMPATLRYVPASSLSMAHRECADLRRALRNIVDSSTGQDRAIPALITWTLIEEARAVLNGKETT